MDVEIVVQGPGSPGGLLAELQRLIEDGSYSRLRNAMAYATRAGAALLLEAAEDRGGGLQIWAIVGLDGYVSDPEALAALRNVLGDRLRVYESVANNSVFHPKAFWFDDEASGDFASLIGSGNLTGQGLGRNVEAATLIRADGVEGAPLRERWDGWWDELWIRAVPLADELLDAYEAIYNRLHRPFLHGDRVVEAEIEEVDETEEIVDVPDPENAGTLWLDAGAITGGAGNQLELPQRIVSFFGFSPSQHNVERYLTLLVHTTEWSDNHLHYYGNAMWRVNVNTQILAAIGQLRHRAVLFTREADSDTYTFRILTPQERAAARATSVQIGTLNQTTAREYGWY